MKQFPFPFSQVFLSFFVFLFFFTACTKKEIKGPQGDPGTPGVGGNANISSTNTFVVNSTDWKVDSASVSLKVSINFTMLTQDVVDKGTVKVYIQTGSSWFELPYDVGDMLMQYGFKTGVLTLYYINIEGGFSPPPATANFRMTIVDRIAKLSRPNSEPENERLIRIADLNTNSEFKTEVIRPA